MQEYTVQRGDYLGKIAQQYNISLQDLLKLNPEIEDPDKIFVGQKIKIPQDSKKISPPVGRVRKQDDEEGAPSPRVVQEYMKIYWTATTMIKSRWKQRSYNDEIEPIQEQAFNWLQAMKSAYPKTYAKFSKLEEGLRKASEYLTQKPSKILDRDATYQLKVQAKDEDGKLVPGKFKVINKGLFGALSSESGSNDLFDLSLIELGIAYGFRIFPKVADKVYDEKYIRDIINKSIGISKAMKKGKPGKPKPYWDYPGRGEKEKAAWQAGLNAFLSRDIQEGNKIIQEYILKNTPQQPQLGPSMVEIIADEVNEVLNNLPEIQIASETLSEDELKSLFSPLARQVVMSVHGKIKEEVKNLVELEIPQDIVIQILGSSEQERNAALEKLDPEVRKALLSILISNDDGTVEISDDVDADGSAMAEPGDD